MADLSVSTYKEKMLEMLNNPAGMQRVCLAQLDAMLDGNIDVVDPSNPFVFLMESATLLSTVAIEQTEINTRKQYPAVAVNQEDLYLHMSDVDYIDRFAKPSMAKFYFLLNLDEVLNNTVIDPNDSYQMNKLVIPRHTLVNVAEHDFMMQYPIEIRKLSYGGIQIVYDVSKVSPLMTLETNVVNWFTTRIENNNFIAIEIPMLQLTLTEYIASLNISTGYVKTYLLNDEYCYTRAYLSDGPDAWEEITTTHTDQVFDPNKVTALIKVFNDNIRFEIPTIYFSNGLASGRNLRLDIYTTKGKTDLILSDYIANQFTVKWKDYDNDNNGIYSAPLNTFKSMAVYSIDTVSGGRDGIDFETLRERVIENAVGLQSLPITNTQIVTTLNNSGYSVVKNLDNITDRQFLATRDLPNAADALNGTTDITLLDNVTESPIATSVRTIFSTMDDLSHSQFVVDNGDRLTIKSNSLFEDINGITNLITNDRKNQLDALPNKNLIDEVNSSRLGYNPFHYVIEKASGSLALRPYYLDNPITIGKVFVQENEGLAFDVSFSKYSIEKTDAGYKLLFVTKSGETFKSYYQLYPNNVQLIASFKTPDASGNCFVDASIKDPELVYGTGQTVVATGELLFELDIISNYDVDGNHNLQLTNFQINNEDPKVISCPLNVDLDIFLLINNYNGPVTKSEMDNNYLDHCDWFYPGHNVIPVRGIIHEKVKLKLGTNLKYLWSNNRIVMSSEVYKTYEYDVPKLYAADEYEIDPITRLKKMTIVDGQVTFNKLHSKGDPYLDSNDDPIMEHKAGDPVLDIDGNPIPVDERKISRLLDICLFDGIYYFATEKTNKLYKDTLPRIISDWLDNDLTDINNRLLERTVVYFYPKNTFGNTKIMIENGKVITTYSEQSFNVKVYVSSDIYNDGSIKDSITKSIIDVIANAIKRNIVSITDIQYNTKIVLGNLVKGVEFSEFGVDKNISTFTPLDDTVGISIQKSLILLSENNISVKENVFVEFIRHEI